MSSLKITIIADSKNALLQFESTEKFENVLISKGQVVGSNGQLYSGWQFSLKIETLTIIHEGYNDEKNDIFHSYRKVHGISELKALLKSFDNQLNLSLFEGKIDLSTINKNYITILGCEIKITT